MAISDRRRHIVRLLWRRLGIAGLFVLVLVAAGGVWSVYQKERESLSLRQEAENQYSTLSQQEAQLKNDIASLETDRGKEAALREQYAVGKKGEGLVIIVDPKASLPQQASSTIMQWVHKFLPFW